MLINNRLREFRKGKKVSQAALAAGVEVSRRFIAYVEKGERTPSLVVALRVSKILDVQVEDIFYLDDGR